MRLKFPFVSLALLACVACDSSDEGGDHEPTDASGSGGRMEGTGGRAPGGGGSAASGGTSSGGRGAATGGGTASGGQTGNGGTASGGTPVSDAGPDAPSSADGGSDASAGGQSSVGDGGGDAEAGLGSCVANHRTPGGRYRLHLHNEIHTQDGSLDCNPGDSCVCSLPRLEEEDGEAILTLGDDIYQVLVDPQHPNDFVTYGGVYGKLEAPTLSLGMFDDVHSESYAKPSEGGFSFFPGWDPSADHLPNPYTISIENLSSTPPCGGGYPCGEPWDTITVTIDTVHWTVQFVRYFHRSGICALPLYTSMQTGTGYLECGD